jgi:hypothetical protein
MLYYQVIFLQPTIKTKDKELKTSINNSQSKVRAAKFPNYALISYEVSNGNIRTYIFLKINDFRLQGNSIRIERVQGV